MDFPNSFIRAGKETCSLDHFVPAPYFRKTFAIKSLKQLNSAAEASVVLCGLGFYELYINGKNITKGLLAPYISNPDDLIYYDAYDILPYLKKGGSVTVSSSPVKPVTDSLADKPYSADDMIEFLEKQDIRLTVVDGGEIIREAGSAKSLNAALIAAACASGAVPFSVEEIENVVRNELKAEYAESNLRAIAAGARAVLG